MQKVNVSNNIHLNLKFLVNFDFFYLTNNNHLLFHQRLLSREIKRHQLIIKCVMVS
jgi:hypothetical protein